MHPASPATAAPAPAPTKEETAPQQIPAPPPSNPGGHHVRAAKFSLAPHSVTTTVVTTTTTKITEFPALPMAQKLKHLDVASFPLANTPTPPALKKFCFDLNGVPTRFQELDLFEESGSKHDPATSPKSSLAQSHLQHHAANLSSIHTAHSALSPSKHSRKRDRGAAFINQDHLHHHDAEFTPPVPPTPFPEAVMSLIPPAAAQIHGVQPTIQLPSIVTNTAALTPTAPNAVINVATMMDMTAELPSPTMSPTATTPPQHHQFMLPVSVTRTNPPSPTSRQASSASNYNHRSLTPSPPPHFNGHHQHIHNTKSVNSMPQTLPPQLTALPSIISTFDALPQQMKSYLLLALLRRSPQPTLQFVSTLVLPALKRDLLGDLPPELAFRVLAKLDLRSLGRVSRVCRRWCGVVGGDGAAVDVWKRRLLAEGWGGEGEVKGLVERWILWRRAVMLGRVKPKVEKDTLPHGEGDEGGDLRRGLSFGSNSNTLFGRSSSGIVGGSESVRFDDEEEDADGDTCAGGKGVQSNSSSSVDHYEFEEDEEEDFFDANVQDDDDEMESNAGKEFMDVIAAAHSDPNLAIDTMAWIKTLDDFSTESSSSVASDSSVVGNVGSYGRRHYSRDGQRHGYHPERLRISRVRTRLRKFLNNRTKSELSHLALQIPQLYKCLYRRHHVIRRNWAKGAFQTIEFPGHGNNVVTCLQFDGDKIVSGSDDQSIHIYDTHSGRLRRKLVGHDGGVWALQYWNDALVSGSTDRSVRVWDMDTGLCTHLFEGHTSTVRCLMIIPPASPAPKGSFVEQDENQRHLLGEPTFPLVVTGSRDATLRVWRLPNPKSDKYHVPHNAHGVVHTHPDDPNNTYDRGPNPYFMHVLTGHQNSVRAIAGQGRVLVSGSYDSTVRVWDLITGECQHVLRGHREKVYSVGYSHDLSRAVSGSLDASVKVWCTKSGVQLHNLEGHTSLVGLLELSPEYLVSAAADQSLRVWNPQTGACQAHLHGHSAAITCFHHDPKLNRVVSGSDGGVKLWELSSAGGGGGSSALGTGPGFEFRQGPNGPEPVYGRFTRDLVSGIAGVWRVRMDERRLVCAISKEGGATYFQVLDFGETAKHGTTIHAVGDGGFFDDEEDDDEEGDDLDEDDGDEGDEGEEGEEDDGEENHDGAGDVASLLPQLPPLPVSDFGSSSSASLPFFSFGQNGAPMESTFADLTQDSGRHQQPGRVHLMNIVEESQGASSSSASSSSAFLAGRVAVEPGVPFVEGTWRPPRIVTRSQSVLRGPIAPVSSNSNLSVVILNEDEVAEQQQHPNVYHMEGGHGVDDNL